MKKRSRRVTLVVVGVLVVLLAGAFVVDRTMSALFGRGLVDFRPSMADVLDGRAASEERLAALEVVTAYSRGFETTGTQAVGTVEFVTCIQGQSNVKRRDPYRLVCSAYASVYRAWSGDFDTVGRRVRADIAFRCSGPRGGSLGGQPAPRAPTSAEDYACESGLTAQLVFASTVGLGPDDAVVSQDPSRYTRYVAGPGPEELVRSLAANDWFAIHTVGKEFYRD